MTTEQKERLLASLLELKRIAEDRDQAQQARLFAERRWNSARLQYAAKHGEIVAEFGEENAPPWIDELHGKR
jgi:hypothetical protein